jgi:hypothetical protein
MSTPWKAAILLLLSIQIAERAAAQSVGRGWFLRPSTSEEFSSFEIGFWDPRNEDLLKFDSATCDRCLAFRLSLAVVREKSTADLEQRIHAEGGLGWVRSYLLLGPYFSFGDAAQASWGARLASGFHVRDHFALEASSEFSPSRSPRYTAGAMVTY